MPYVTLAVAAIGAYSAYSQKKKAEAGINKLKDWKPKYKSAEEIRREAETAITEGYSAEEKGAFNQALARRSNQAYQRATQTNPNLASQVQAGINYGNIGALSEFSARDAALRRQKTQDYISRATGQYNAQTGADISTKAQQEQAYGLAKQQANANIYNSLLMGAYAGTKIGAPTATTPTVDAGTGSSLGGQAPLQSMQAPPSQVGTNQWAQGLYRTPDQPFPGMMNAPVSSGPLRPTNPYANTQMGSNVPSQAFPSYNQGQWISSSNSYNPYY